MKFSINFKTSKKIFAILITFFGIIFVSCQKDGDSYSFNSSMAEVDSLIRTNQVNEALSLLKKSEKNASTAISRLGLYKRYKKLGEKSLAEKTLRKAIKKFPSNPEVIAVYGNHLLREDRIAEAEKLTQVLSGTKYGSIYSEAVLKKNSSNNLSAYLTNNFSNVYKDIYDQTLNSTWLINAALVSVANGDYTNASLLQENILKNNRQMTSAEAFFWALVQFDAASYDICLQNVKSVTSEKYKPLAASVASDCYMILDEIDKSEEIREALISSPNSEIPDVVAVNSAIWSYRNKKYKRAYDLLINVLNKNPDYAPALLTYGKLSWIDSQPILMEDLEKTLRQTSLRTEEMREFDERPRFIVDDAIYRLLNVEKKYQSIQHENKDDSNIIDAIDSLIVERISLYLRKNKDLPIKARTAEIWKTLEKNESGLNIYPAKLVYFSVQQLISYGFVEEAHQLFTNYINAKYLGNEKKEKVKDSVEIDIFGGEKRIKAEIVPESVAKLAFGESVAKEAALMNIWEVELAAYFALLDGNIDIAKKLYEFVLFESGGVVNTVGGDYSKKFENISTLASVSSAVNLSMIYSSMGHKNNAKLLYGLASGRCEDVHTKSKILQRVAKLEVALGDFDSAKKSADYSLSLDSQNAEARLLKRQLSDEANGNLKVKSRK